MEMLAQSQKRTDQYHMTLVVLKLRYRKLLRNQAESFAQKRMNGIFQEEYFPKEDHEK